MSRFNRFVSMALLSLMLVFFGLTAVQAQMGPGGGQGGQQMGMGCDERFAAMDTKADGKISKEEFMSGPHKGVGSQPLEDSFKAADTNGDGMLTKEEFCAGKGAHGGMGMGKGKAQ